ncbi:AAA family ATPase [Planctomicrobium sp. SH527]|uniref:AAA family ATPase n=1 Tax=Planctomicrobium sp. SH527 TaxID=3448123 RepID=UPI003F5C7B79
MSLTERLGEYIRACFTGLWIESHEHADALSEIAQLCQQEQWTLITWDLDQGLRGAGIDVGLAGTDPLSAIRSLNSRVAPDSTTLLILQNFHRFLNSAEIIQALAQQVLLGKHNRTILLILSPVVQLPVELEKLFVVLEHELPDRAQLEQIARGIATEEQELPSGAELDVILDAAAGLTRLEVENAFSLSLVRHGRITSAAIWELKSGMLKKSGLLELHQGTETFSSLGGLESLKTFCQQALRSNRRHPLTRARGVLLLSPPGCGKSQFCKCLGNEVGRPVLTLDVGSLLGSLVGQSEERTRQALRIIDAMAPCVLMVDEVEKAFAGVSGSSDSGVTSRMFGRFLTWLNDHTSDVFVVCTANDISKLPPEFSRSGRFDALFFLDLPSRGEKDAIWNLYLQQFEIEQTQKKPVDDQWTGAEIKACCRLAALLEVPLLDASRYIVPVAVTNAESVDTLRTWASGRCLSANQPGLYQHAQKTAGSRRNVRRDSSLN